MLQKTESSTTQGQIDIRQTGYKTIQQREIISIEKHQSQ